MAVVGLGGSYVITFLGLGLSMGGSITRILLLPLISNMILIIIAVIIFKYMMESPKTQTIVNPMITIEENENNEDRCICLVLCAALFSI